MERLGHDLLLFILAAIALTIAVSATAWWMQGDRRTRRMLSRAVGGRPDAVVAANGSGAALELQSNALALAWGRGAGLQVRDLDELTGMELILDGEVAARTFRGEGRRALDRAAEAAHEVRLRLVFDDPRDPDFEVWLWRTDEEAGPRSGSASAALEEARRWLARGDALLRRSRSGSQIEA